MIPERMDVTNSHSEADARVQIQDIIEEMKDNLNLAEPSNDCLDVMIDRVDKIFNDAVSIDDENDPQRGPSIDVSVARMDIHVFSQLARQCHLRVRRVAASSWVFRASDFANRIVRLLNVDERSQSESLTIDTRTKLNSMIAPYFNRCPPLRPLLGAIQLTKVEVLPKERKQRQPREKQQAVVTQKPKRLTDITEEDQNTKVSKRVEFIHKKLRRLATEKRLSFYHFILDPTSFSNTIENLFYVSFLLRDGFVALEDETESGLPDLVVTNKKSSNYSQAQVGVTKKQLILALDYAMWQELVEGLELTKALIPTAEEQAEIEAQAAALAEAEASFGPSQTKGNKRSRRE